MRSNDLADLQQCHRRCAEQVRPECSVDDVDTRVSSILRRGSPNE
jgi:hypothetical protein